MTLDEFNLTQEIAGAMGELLDGLASNGLPRDIMVTAAAAVVQLVIAETGLPKTAEWLRNLAQYIESEAAVNAESSPAVH